MATMKAALHDGKGSMHLVELPRPVAEPGYVVVRVRTTGICGSDLLIYADATQPETQPAGHEIAGEVAEVGPGVEGLRPGDRVAVEGIGQGRACNRCWYCRQGQFRFCQYRSQDTSGGFAQYLRRKAPGCYKLPDSLSWEEGALVEPLAVSVHGVRLAHIRGGETVVVLGAGTIGLTSVAAARALGAGQVFVTARHPHQAEMARRLGADHVLSPNTDEMWDAVAQATEGRGADVVIETVGGHSSDTLLQAVKLCRSQGKVVILGGFRVPVTMDMLQPLLKEQTFLFSSCYSVLDGHHDFEIAIGLMASGRVPLKQIVTHRFPLDRIQEALDTAYNKKTGAIKVQVVP